VREVSPEVVSQGEVLALFSQVVELSSEEREELLAKATASGGERVVEEVRALLATHEEVETSDFLGDNQSVLLPDDTLEALIDHPAIESYRILERIGAGGMATVFLAEQRSPIWRRVAIKVLKHGLSGSGALARFQLEQQALALMNHPNIAKVLDTGTTEGARPYFVMEYVPGLSITQHCWRRKSSLRDRLDLFLQVCAAVEHAHQKGIIHRDLKPSNILVSDVGDVASVQVIDFGIAKTTFQGVTEIAPHTLHGQLVGTPEYMSPEQIQHDGTKVDTRSDIYSLGVVLHEMLLGETPFHAPSDSDDPVSAVCNAVLHDEPKRPSDTRDAIQEPSDPSLTERAITARELRGDLDWIILRALAKDRADRYATVHELAQDIERHLRHEAVEAGPPSLVYRIGKFARRNRAVTALGGVLLAIGLFLGASTALMLEQMHKESEQSITIHRELFEHAGSPMMTFDGDTGRMVEANQSTLEAFGYENRSDFLEVTVYDISAEPEQTRNAVAKILSGELVHIPRRVFRRRDGSTFPAQIFCGKYEWNGKTMGVGIVRPIDEEETAVARSDS